MGIDQDLQRKLEKLGVVRVREMLTLNQIGPTQRDQARAWVEAHEREEAQGHIRSSSRKSTIALLISVLSLTIACAALVIKLLIK